MCNKQLSTGEELYILDEFKFVCKEDYQNNNGKDTILLSGDFTLTETMCSVSKREENAHLDFPFSFSTLFLLLFLLDVQF